MIEFQMTHDEHSVPQVYLKGFSFDDKTVYAYKLDCQYSSRQKKSIKNFLCYKDLYESKSADGNYLHANVLENRFRELENLFGNFRRLIERKLKEWQNDSTYSFVLSDVEIEYLMYCVGIQLFRIPSSIESFGLSVRNILCQNTLFMNCSDDVWHNMALAAIYEPRCVCLVEEFVKFYRNGKVSIVYVPEGKLWTSDVVISMVPTDIHDENNIDSYILYPITSNICLVIYNDVCADCNSKFVVGTEGFRIVHNAFVVANANQYVVSAVRFVQEDEDFIRLWRNGEIYQDDFLPSIVTELNKLRRR